MVTTTAAREENGEFCVAVAPATMTSWLKALAVKLSRPSAQSGSYTGLIGFNPRRLKGLKGDELPRNGPNIYANSSSSSHLPKINSPYLFCYIVIISNVTFINNSLQRLGRFAKDGRIQ